MKNVLICYSKSSFRDTYQNLIQKYPEAFPDKYNWSSVIPVRHAYDPYTRLEQRNNGIWVYGDTTFHPLTLKDISIPQNTYITLDRPNENINVDDYDEFICISDPDIYGVLECVKFLEDNNIPLKKASFVWNCDLTVEAAYEAFLSPTPLEPLYEKTLAEMEEDNFSCPYKNDRNFAIVRGISH